MGFTAPKGFIAKRNLPGVPWRKPYVVRTNNMASERPRTVEVMITFVFIVFVCRNNSHKHKSTKIAGIGRLNVSVRNLNPNFGTLIAMKKATPNVML